jgi:EAL and modified HD-GYP domain-containing signal transduction protein
MKSLRQSPEPAPAPEFFLGRQPILDRTRNTVAYELLFRAGQTTTADVRDGRAATASVIAHAFSELGIHAALGNCRAFINFDAELLLSDIPELLPADRTVLEILETVTITQEIVARCRQLRSLGFSFALDDVVRVDESYTPILPFIDIIKIDLVGTPADRLPGLLAAARRPGLALLAEKVDNSDQADQCEALGFDFFQGYFFARPVVLAGRRTDPSRRLLLHLLQQVMAIRPNSEIELTLKQAPELSYKLMRLVNSVGMGLRNPIQSLAHALVVLGQRQLQRWLQVLLFAHPSSGAFPSPLLTLAATRGKLMELLADHARGNSELRDQAFMTGILSLVDALLGLPMTEILTQINVGDEVRNALLNRSGRVGSLLQIVEALEGDDIGALERLLATVPSCTMSDLTAAQIAAMAWANDIATPAGVA